MVCCNAVMADETMDISYNEQLVVGVRWVDKEYEIQDDVFGLLEISSQTSSYLTSAIQDVFLICGLSLAYEDRRMTVHLTGVLKPVYVRSCSSLSCTSHKSCHRRRYKEVSIC